MELKKIITENQLAFVTEDGTKLAMIDFVEEDGVLTLESTYVDDELRGQGMAARLMEEFIAFAKEEQKTILPICSYAVAWMELHPEEK